MIIPWQIQHDISRARLEDTLRAAKYAHRNAETCRRPMRRIAAILRWMSERLADAVPRRGVDHRRTAIDLQTVDVGRLDLRLTVALIDGSEDPRSGPTGTGGRTRHDAVGGRPSQPRAAASGDPSRAADRHALTG